MGGACSSADTHEESDDWLPKPKKRVGLVTRVIGKARNSIRTQTAFHHRTGWDEEVLASHRSHTSTQHRPDAKIAAALLRQELAGRSLAPIEEPEQEPEPASRHDGESKEEERGRGNEERFDQARRSPRQPSTSSSSSDDSSPDETPRNDYEPRRRQKKESINLARKFEQAVQKRHREIEQHRQQQEEAHRAQVESQRSALDDWGRVDEPHGDPSFQPTPRSLRHTPRSVRHTRGMDLEPTRSGNLGTPIGSGNLSSAPPSGVRSMLHNGAIASGTVEEQVKSMSTAELNAINSRVGDYSHIHRAYRSVEISRAASRDTSRAASPLAQTRSGPLAHKTTSHVSRSLPRNYSPRKAHDSLSRSNTRRRSNSLGALGDESLRSRGHTRDGRLKV